MKLSDVLPKIHAPKGVSSMIAGVMSGDFAPLRDQSAIGETLEDARMHKHAAERAQRDAQSDWAYWGYAGDVAYWRAVVNLLEAAELVGADNLPDVALPRMDGMVMDVQYKLEQFGKEVLDVAKTRTVAATTLPTNEHSGI